MRYSLQQQTELSADNGRPFTPEKGSRLNNKPLFSWLANPFTYVFKSIKEENGFGGEGEMCRIN